MTVDSGLFFGSSGLEAGLAQTPASGRSLPFTKGSYGSEAVGREQLLSAIRDRQTTAENRRSSMSCSRRAYEMFQSNPPIVILLAAEVFLDIKSSRDYLPEFITGKSVTLRF